MSDGRKLNDHQVKLLQKDILLRYESVKGQVVALQQTLDTMEAQWRGIGAGAFNDKQRLINQRMQSIGRTLLDFLDNIELTKKDKDRLEDGVRATMNSVDVELGASKSAISGY
ncbi:WXG100 family type VII secretion target [Streptomyces sp. O3]